MRSSASARNRPTPRATARIKVRLGIAGTCFASTCRSGSATVTSMPSRKPKSKISQTRLLLVMAAPTRSPMGVMESSAPKVKHMMPRISSTPPRRKHSKTLGEMGATEKQSTRTNPTMGTTACIASRSFSFNGSRDTFRKAILLFLVLFIIPWKRAGACKDPVIKRRTERASARQRRVPARSRLSIYYDKEF